MPLKITNEHVLHLKRINHNKYELDKKGTYCLSFNRFERLKREQKKLGLIVDDQSIFVSKNARNLMTMVFVIEELQDNDQIVIKLDGKAASGKTTLAQQLSMIYEMNVIHMDDFFKKPEIDQTTAYGKYATNIDFNKMNQSVVKPFLSKDKICYRPFDFKTHSHVGEVRLPYKKYLLIEGAYSMHPSLKIDAGLTVFYGIGKYKQIKRIYDRNGFKRLRMFLKKWIKNENTYHKALKTQSSATVVLKA